MSTQLEITRPDEAAVPPAIERKVLPSPGNALSAMERAVPEYRKRVNGGLGGVARAAHRVDGFRDGWQACLAYLRSIPEGQR